MSREFLSRRKTLDGTVSKSIRYELGERGVHRGISSHPNIILNP